jgi:hypothetical protein
MINATGAQAIRVRKGAELQITLSPGVESMPD